METRRTKMDTRRTLITGLAVAFAALFSGASLAIPSLQLSGDGSSDWNYDSGDQTWAVSGTTSFNLLAHANATTADGGNGPFAWDAAGAADRYAYLVVAAVPDLGGIDSFDISINGGSVSMVTSGYGRPPLEDPNSIPSHGIYNTYFEVYEFQFSGPIVDIKDEQPGKTGTGKGYTETLAMEVLSLNPQVDGLHFDLFTVSDSGKYNPNPNLVNKFLVNSVAPYSHDAEFIPEPGILVLVAVGLLGISVRRFMRRTNH